MIRTRTGYLVDAVTSERLAFPYNPEAITDHQDSRYASVSVVGRRYPWYQYIAGEARQVQFTLPLFKGAIQQQVAWLKALQDPQEAEVGFWYAPHPVVLVMGQLYPGLTCILKQVNVRYFSLFNPQTLAPERATVDLVLEETEHVSRTEAL